MSNWVKDLARRVERKTYPRLRSARRQTGDAVTKRPFKTALVKQALDVFGPWSGVLWKDTSPERLFDMWPGKAVYWELTCVLKADWYIIPQTLETDYTRDAIRRVAGRAELTEKHVKNITPPEDIPFSDYDVVITFDPILSPPKLSRILYAYYVQEHWDGIYAQSLRKPAPNYDLFLDHMMAAPNRLRALPQPVSFPYIHDHRLMRSLFGSSQQEAAWVDWRTLMTLAMKQLGEAWCPEAQAELYRLQDSLGIEIRCRTSNQAKTYGISDSPQWGDAAHYFRELAECRYYVAVGRIAGAGQALADAAALGCLCIGQKDKPYHRLLCHPLCLCKGMADMPRRLRALRENPELQHEVLAFQDAELLEHFHVRPLNHLQSAIQMKDPR